MQSRLGLDPTTKKTRQREILEEMVRMVPWAQLPALVEPRNLRGKTA